MEHLPDTTTTHGHPPVQPSRVGMLDTTLMLLALVAFLCGPYFFGHWLSAHERAWALGAAGAGIAISAVLMWLVVRRMRAGQG